MFYKFKTPSDPITFAAVDDQVAFLVTVLVSNGKAFYEPEDGHKVPSSFLIFAGDRTEALIKEALGGSIDDFMKNRRGVVIAALDSFAYGDFADRKIYDKTVELLTDDPVKLSRFRETHDEVKRSSLSEWCKYAWVVAAGMKQEAAAAGKQ